mmetsp:Transcript_5436/g.11433  ORF Transcript_5436/g.11433 Transcript_5436/m.11433 type:complete len:209 (+) Transcript_5436:653-1279(+)
MVPLQRKHLGSLRGGHRPEGERPPPLLEPDHGRRRDRGCHRRRPRTVRAAGDGGRRAVFPRLQSRDRSGVFESSSRREEGNDQPRRAGGGLRDRSLLPPRQGPQRCQRSPRRRRGRRPQRPRPREQAPFVSVVGGFFHHQKQLGIGVGRGGIRPHRAREELVGETQRGLHGIGGLRVPVCFCLGNATRRVLARPARSFVRSTPSCCLW